MKTETIVELVKTIEEKTRNNGLSWADTSATSAAMSLSCSQFSAVLAGYRISIREFANVSGQDSPDYQLVIGHAGGSELENFNDGELSQMASREAIPFQSFIVMQSIYKNARRQALGVDYAIDSILAALKKTA